MVGVCGVLTKIRIGGKGSLVIALSFTSRS